MVVGSIALVASRASDLRSEHRLDSLLSRESVFLLNNLVLVALCFVIFWGTFFPLISEAVTGDEASVGPPWFDRYTVPLALILVLLSGIGPVIAWRRATAANLRRNLLKPALAGLIVLAALAALGAGREPGALLMFGLAAFVLAAVGQELWRGVRARRAMSGDGVPLGAGGRSCAATGAATAATSCTWASRCCSSASPRPRASRTSARCCSSRARPPRSATTRSPTSSRPRTCGRRPNGRLEKIDLGAQLRVERDGAPWPT